MSFLLNCPNCGPRTAYEFEWGGEDRPKHLPDASLQEWAHAYYDRRNVAGVQKEWWFHSGGCRRWFLAIRDTRTNAVQETLWP